MTYFSGLIMCAVHLSESLRRTHARTNRWRPSGDVLTSRKARRSRQWANTPASGARSKVATCSVLRQARPRLRVTWGGLLTSQVRRLSGATKPLLVVVVFLLILGLAGGVEQGTVWP